jgi:hypothetical protein
MPICEPPTTPLKITWICTKYEQETSAFFRSHRTEVSAPTARESLSDDEVVGSGTARVATESVYIAPVDEGLRASRMLIVKVLSRVLFTLYLLTLLWLVLFKISYDISAILAHYQMRSLNLIPFVTWGQTGSARRCPT